MTSTTHTAPADVLAQQAAAGTLEQTLRLAPTLLCPSPTNPRKRFEPARVQSIADSMRSVGQISPIRARPNPQHQPGDGRAPWEIVVGETRWRAAQLAELPARPPGDGSRKCGGRCPPETGHDGGVPQPARPRRWRGRRSPAGPSQRSDRRRGQR